MDALKFRVYGVPAPKGSKTAFVTRGRAVVVEGASATGRQKLSSWMAEVTREASNARPEEPWVGPIGVMTRFYLPKPKSAPKKKRWSDKKPDIDKIVRATFDAMTGVIFHDDGQVAWSMETKCYATPEEPSGAMIRVYRLETEV